MNQKKSEENFLFGWNRIFFFGFKTITRAFSLQKKNTKLYLQ